MSKRRGLKYAALILIEAGLGAMDVHPSVYFVVAALFLLWAEADRPSVRQRLGRLGRPLWRRNVSPWGKQGTRPTGPHPAVVVDYGVNLTGRFSDVPEHPLMVRNSGKRDAHNIEWPKLVLGDNYVTFPKAPKAMVSGASQEVRPEITQRDSVDLENMWNIAWAVNKMKWDATSDKPRIVSRSWPFVVTCTDQTGQAYASEHVLEFDATDCEVRMRLNKVVKL